MTSMPLSASSGSASVSVGPLAPSTIRRTASAFASRTPISSSSAAGMKMSAGVAKNSSRVIALEPGYPRTEPVFWTWSVSLKGLMPSRLAM